MYLRTIVQENLCKEMTYSLLLHPYSVYISKKLWSNQTPHHTPSLDLLLRDINFFNACEVHGSIIPIQVAKMESKRGMCKPNLF